MPQTSHTFNARVPPTWGELLDDARPRADMAGPCAALIAEAQKAAGLEVIRRVFRHADIGRHRTWLDQRGNVQPDGRVPETFALAMSDFQAARMLADELPLLSAGYRLTGRAALLQRVLAQLEELLTWRPIQRPGWSLCGAGGIEPRLRDGNWLATGCGIRAIGDVLQILPAGSVPGDLRRRIDEQLAAEIASVVDDWRARRPWFVRADNPSTNQWVLPNEGLVRACLIVGKAGHGEAYELGVANLLRSMDSYGAAGEFPEGLGYAAFTVQSLLNAARAAAGAGDRRLIGHPFLRAFPLWAVHHIQPGLQAINCFDATSISPRRRERPDAMLALLAACTGSAAARWAIATRYDAPAGGLAGLAAAATAKGPGPEAPLTFAAYDMARRVNWRSSWDEDATGLWVRGGHARDQHDHQDRGHVNFILRGRPVLIEAGTPAYHHPELKRLFASGVGHNVLQLGDELPPLAAFPTKPGHVTIEGWQRPGTVAPIEVRRLDSSGGDIRVDCSHGYAGPRLWTRDVAWDAGGLQVRDEVALAADAGPRIILFRWHLGTAAPVELAGGDRSFRASWDGIALALEASRPILVRQEMLPDWTLTAREWDDPSPDPLHVCLVVRTIEPASDLTLVMRMSENGDGRKMGTHPV